MPHKQRTSVAAKRLVNSRQALALRAEGLMISDIAQRMNSTPATVKRYIDHALSTESMFPSSLDASQVSQLRQLEAEALVGFRQAAHEVLQKVQARVGTDGERSMDVTGVARLTEAAARVSDRLAKMFGLDVPVRIQEESLRLNVTKIDNKITIGFDESMLNDDGRPVPGLHIGVAPSLLGGRALPEIGAEPQDG